MTKKSKKQSSPDSKQNNLAWANVFSQSKLVLYCNKFDINTPMIIYAADSNFPNFFGRELNFRLCLDDFVGPETSTETFNGIKDSMTQGETLSSYITLYRFDGVSVSCHITLIPITAGIKSNVKSVQNQEGMSIMNSVEPSIQSIYLPLSLNTSTEGVDTMWAIVTIRSAACIEYAKEVGVGFLDIPFVNADVKFEHLKSSSSSSSRRRSSLRGLNAQTTDPVIQNTKKSLIKETSSYPDASPFALIDPSAYLKSYLDSINKSEDRNESILITESKLEDSSPFHLGSHQAEHLEGPQNLIPNQTMRQDLAYESFFSASQQEGNN